MRPRLVSIISRGRVKPRTIRDRFCLRARLAPHNSRRSRLRQRFTPFKGAATALPAAVAGRQANTEAGLQGRERREAAALGPFGGQKRRQSGFATKLYPFRGGVFCLPSGHWGGCRFPCACRRGGFVCKRWPRAAQGMVGAWPRRVGLWVARGGHPRTARPRHAEPCGFRHSKRGGDAPK